MHFNESHLIASATVACTSGVAALLMPTITRVILSLREMAESSKKVSTYTECGWTLKRWPYYSVLPLHGSLLPPPPSEQVPENETQRKTPQAPPNAP